MPNIKSQGCFGMRPIVAFTSDQSHYSIKKAIHWLGIGMDNLIIVKTDKKGCMNIDDLIQNIENVINSNRQPFFVNATAGTTGTCFFISISCKLSKIFIVLVSFGRF